MIFTQHLDPNQQFIKQTHIKLTKVDYSCLGMLKITHYNKWLDDSISIGRPSVNQPVRPFVCLFVQIFSSSKQFSLLRFFLLSHCLIEVAGSVEQQIRAQWVFARKLKSIRYGVLFQRFVITCDGKLKWQNQDIAVLLCEIWIEVTRKR